MRSLIFCFLIGCASVPTVQVPQQLPHPTKVANKVLPQRHYITQEELQEEIQKVQDSYILFSTDLSNLEWWYIGRFFHDIRETAQHIIDSMNNSTTEEEMQYYRRLYYELNDLLSNAGNWWNDKRLKLQDIRILWEIQSNESTP